MVDVFSPTFPNQLGVIGVGLWQYNDPQCGITTQRLSDARGIEARAQHTRDRAVHVSSRAQK